MIKKDTKRALSTRLLLRCPVSRQYGNERAVEYIKCSDSNEGGCNQ